ncbi:Uncharacterised protein [Salmonella enterica subsp. enterica serovar Bovismorbificans]|uniref:Uncharacterized protein n=1 Tax=Salmonella enterica subsp. enterica serovar Bovismorbificans TaxID=58097 RepID=A0A655BLN9_SALET|nr:Uncharacterised protein [Salmonella enterica subsp. enterica serovar Bovismorbificans]
MWLPVQRPGRKNEEKVGPQAFPVHLTQAGDFSAKRLGIAHKGYAIAEFDVQPLRQPLFHGDFARFWRPVTGDQRIMRRARILPGQIQFTVE